MHKLTFRDFGALALSLFFVVGAAGNFMAPPDIAADYARWGYPSFFHYVTAALEITTAGLLIFRRTRVTGALLGCVVMASAVATLVWHVEYLHALAPIVVLAACVAIVAINRRRG